MKQYTIAKIAKMGDYDEKYGQAFWAETNEQLEPVRFNLMKGEPEAGNTITCEEVLMKTSSRGTDYHQLRKVKIGDGVQTTPPTQAAGMSESQFNQLKELLQENHRMLRQLTGEGDNKKPDYDEPVDLSDIPF